MKKIPNKRRDTEEGHMAALVRRKMITRNHGDLKKYTRKNKHKGWDSNPSLIKIGLVKEFFVSLDKELLING